MKTNKIKILFGVDEGMTVNKKYFWIRLKVNFFKQKEIKKLRRIAGGDTFTIIYLKMQLLSASNDGKLFYDAVEENFAEELALELDEDATNVEMTLAYLKKHKLIEQIEVDEFFLPEAKSNIGKEGASAERVRKCREKKKMLQSNTNETISNTEIEIELEKQIELEKEIYSSSKENEEEELLNIMRLCQSLDFKLKKFDANNFVKIFGSKQILSAIGIAANTEAFRNNKIKNYGSYLGTVLKDLSRDKKVDVTINKAKNKFTDYEQRADMSKEEEDELLGWD